MAGSNSQFDEFLAQEIRSAKGLYFPVKTSILRRLLTRKAYCEDLHPNPEDEFCVPKIGPNYKIISEYQQLYVNAMKRSQNWYEGEPIVVERTHPEGYRIINGHHRWAAALRIGQPTIPVKVVNLTHEEDVKKILENSTHTKRAALDLDEVLFRGEGLLERALPFPWNRFYPERLRRGVPALFHFLAKNGYDIWLYSSSFYSSDYIQRYFRRYHGKVTGVITAIGKRAKAADDAGKSLESLITDKYRFTVHIDNDTVLQIVKQTKELREFALSGGDAAWSQEVMDAITQIEQSDPAPETP
jgi:hypothetical protein